MSIPPRECYICSQPLTNPVKIPGCTRNSHIVDDECLQQWIQTREKANLDPVCPIDCQPFDPKTVIRNVHVTVAYAANPEARPFTVDIPANTSVGAILKIANRRFGALVVPPKEPDPSLTILSHNTTLVDLGCLPDDSYSI